MREKIEAGLIKIIENNEELFIPKEEINMELNLVERGINSLIFVRVIVSLEEEFGIEFDDDDLDLSKFITLKDLADYIEKQMKEESE